ncbi:hypothetical protein [uncultured Amnibacterium sp.]|uniref:hypothetical protein n=1 Tax=uncultured Amnibacterium sp. TaxID=1631851 RepID=UPI0035CBD915
MSAVQVASGFLFAGAGVQIYVEARTHWSGLEAYVARAEKGDKPRDFTAAENAAQRGEREWLRSPLRYWLVLAGWTCVGLGALIGFIGAFS